MDCRMYGSWSKQTSKGMQMRHEREEEKEMKKERENGERGIGLHHQ